MWAVLAWPDPFHGGNSVHDLDAFVSAKNRARCPGGHQLSTPDSGRNLRILTGIGTLIEPAAGDPGGRATRLNYHGLGVIRRNPFPGALVVVACLAGFVPDLHAQGVEITPIGGYRFGGDFFELVTSQPVDLDGAPAVGMVLNIPGSDGLQFEGAFSHQHANVSTPTRPFAPAALWRISVDHWQAGALQEFRRGRMRPFLTGVLGLTRYAADADSEIRFLIAAGGGVKLFPVRHLGLRLESRVFATFDDADNTFIACAGGTCLFSIRTDIVWQAEFTAGLIVRFP